MKKKVVEIEKRVHRIEKKALVRGVGDRVVHCEFEHSKAYNAPLGFYLLNWRNKE